MLPAPTGVDDCGVVLVASPEAGEPFRHCGAGWPFSRAEQQLGSGILRRVVDSAVHQNTVELPAPFRRVVIEESDDAVCSGGSHDRQRLAGEPAGADEQ
jgi:hypothetical protein